MTARLVPYALALLAVAGLGISSYLTVAHWGDKAIVCGGLGQCDYVNSSEYATIGGVPVALFGAGLYLAMLGAALLWARLPEDERWPVVYWGLALAGAGYAAYLTYVELGVIHAICVWCVVSATILTVSLITATAALFWPRARESQDETPAPSPRPVRVRQRRPSSPR